MTSFLLRSSALRTRSIDVLIVDADPEASATLQSALEENGCIARVSMSASEALSELARRRPEVVVLAVAIVGSRTALAEAIASTTTEHGAIAIAAIQSRGEPALDRWLDAYLREPVTIEEITDVVRRLGADMRAARAAAREALG